MADQDVIILIGSSNMAGYLANLYDVPNADYFRWVSQDTPIKSVTSTASGSLFTSLAHGLLLNTKVSFATNGGTLSSGITAGTVYFAIPITANTFQVSATYSGTAVTLGTDSSGSPTVSTAAGQTYNASIPGVKVWTPKRPYSTNTQRSVVQSTSLTVTYSGAAISSPAAVTNDSWIFIKSGSGRGNLRKVTGVSSTQLTVGTAFSPTINPRVFSAVASGSGSVFTSTAHGLVLNTPITFAANGGGLPSPVVAGTTYYPIQVTTDTFLVATTPSGGSTSFASLDAGDVFNAVGHGLVLDTPIIFSSSGTLSSPLVPNTVYYARTIATDTFQVSLTPGGGVLPLGSNSSGSTTFSRAIAVSASSGSPTYSRVGFDTADTLVVLQDSHTISAFSVDNLTVTKTGTTPALTVDALIGKFVLFFDAAAGTEITRKIASNTATTITFDAALTTLPAVGTGFCVLTGANSAESIATLSNAELQNLTFTLDDYSPVFLTGLDYTNWDFSAFASPRGLSYDPNINSTAELSWQVRSKFGRELAVLQLGVSASMISPYTWIAALPSGGIPTAASGFVGPIHDMTSLDYHPSSPAGIYPILVAAIDSMRTLIEADGNTMKVRGIFINLFDNDGSDDQRASRVKSNTILLRDTLRTLLGDDTIPWIMSGPSAYAGGPGAYRNTSIYRQLNEIAAEDPKSGVVDTRSGYTYCTEDSLHLTAYSQIRLGQDFFRVWEPIYDDIAGKPPTVDIEICNRALTVIGESPNITSIDPAGGSAHAPLCELLFDDAVRMVADSRHWSFADQRVPLQKVQLASPTIVAVGSINVFETATPHGLSIGSPLTFELSAADTGTVPTPLVAGTVYYVAAIYGPKQFMVTDTVGGYGTAITLTSVGTGEWRIFKESDRDGAAFMYALPTDCRTERSVVPTGSPDDWPGMDGALVGTPYAGIGVVSTSRNGLNYSLDSGGFGAVRPIPCKRALSRGGDQVIYTDLEDADLIYSRTLTDTTQWPPLFQEAVVFQLAAGLGGAIKRDVRLVDWCLGKAQAFISEAARVDAQRVVERDRQRYPWSR